MANQSKFNKEEKKLIVSLFLKGKSQIEVKRAFMKEHGYSRKFYKIHPGCFKNVFDTYNKNGERAVGIRDPKKFDNHHVNQEIIDKVCYFYEYISVSIRVASRHLKIPRETVRRILKKHLGKKFYRVH